jgi:hypothetical protein
MRKLTSSPLSDVDPAKLPREWGLVWLGDLLLGAQYGLNSSTDVAAATAIVGMKDIQNGVPCTRLVRDQGGHFIAVYQPESPKKKSRAEKLITDKRADFIAPADYSEGLRLDESISTIIDKVAAKRRRSHDEARVIR